MRYLRRLLGNDEDARDLVQDVYVEAWRVAQRGSPPFMQPVDDAAAQRWILRVGYCRAVSALRHGNVLSWEPLDGVKSERHIWQALRTSFEDQITEREALRAALAQLDPQDAASLLLHELHGYTSAEIGETLGISADATRKRLSRAIKALRTAYERHDTTLPTEGEAVR
jgi:RNA polymerase sigma-70 factor (ECF subfamily)